jgi:acylphosphatase
VSDKPAKASAMMVVTGRVQGVFYRMFAHREANSLGLCG